MQIRLSQDSGDGNVILVDFKYVAKASKRKAKKIELLKRRRQNPQLRNPPS